MKRIKYLLISFDILNYTFNACVEDAVGESARLPPLWPWFGSRILRHMWFEFVVGSGHCSEGLRCPRLSQSPFLWESSGAENGLFAPAAR